MVNQFLKFSLCALFVVLGTDLYSQCPAITCPSNLSVANDSGICTAVVNYIAPVGTNNCGGQQTQTFNHTAAAQTFTVPSGVTSLTVDMYGAQGGSGGGMGGRVQATMTVTPGEVLQINVGGQGGNSALGVVLGGFNGGGNSGNCGPQYCGSGGGGGTDIRRGGTALTNRVLVAGGGGGSHPINSTQNAGAGGGLIGGDVTTTGNGCVLLYATGGSQVAGGNNSTSTGGCCTGTSTPGGSLGQGADGSGPTPNCNGGDSGSGGGGGYYGGGSGFVYSSGAGGSSYAGPGTSAVTHTQGARTGDGQVILTWTGSGPSSTSLTSGPAPGSAFPLGASTVIYTVTDGLGNTATCSFSVSVTDTTFPNITCPSNVTASSTNSSCSTAVTYPAPVGTDNCSGVTITLYSGLGSGASFPVGVTTENYTATDGAGNTMSCSFTVTVTSNLSGSQTLTICNGDSLVVGTHVYSATGNYTDTLNSVNGCDSIHTTQLTVAGPINTATSVSGDTVTASLAGAGYQWINCSTGSSIIPGQTSQTYVAPATGSYAVIITSSGCTDTSTCTDVIVGIQYPIFGRDFSIYPNPANDKITIDFGEKSFSARIELMDLNGKILLSGFARNAQEFVLDIHQLPRGFYLVKMKNESGEKVMEMMKD